MRDVGQVGGTTTHLDMLSQRLECRWARCTRTLLGAHVPSAVRNLGIVLAGGGSQPGAAWMGHDVCGVDEGAGSGAPHRAGVDAIAGAVAAQGGRYPRRVLNAQDVYSVPGLRRRSPRLSALRVRLRGLYHSVRLGRSYLVRSNSGLCGGGADRIVTVDTRLRDFALNHVPEKASAVTALMNFIDTSLLFPQSRGSEGAEALGDRRGACKDGCSSAPAGREPREKENGVVYPALALAAMLPEERERFVLLHAGEGGERAAIEEVVGRYGLEAQVRLLGNQDRSAISELYRLCDT